MDFIQDPWFFINIFNMILCIGIFLLGLWGYISSRESMLFLIGIAFGIFGITHLISLLNLAGGLEIEIIIGRVVAYLLVAFAMNKMLFFDKC